jgi:hypothetical protein
MTKFAVGKVYSMSSPCDHNCIWTYEVIKRTEKTIVLQDEYGKVKRCRISEWRDCERVLPLGSYSMAPVLSADNVR